MADIEGIKFILEAEFRNEKQLDAFQAKLRAVRQEITALRRAQRNLARSRVGVDGQKTGKARRSNTQKEIGDLRKRRVLVQQIAGDVVKTNKASLIGLKIDQKRLGVVTAIAAQQRLSARAVTEQAAAQRTAGQAARSATRQQEKTNSVWSKYLGTIRGVVVGLIAYRGLTRSLQFINDAVRGAVEFGNQLEVAQFAIGGLITGAAELRDTQGDVLDTTESYTASLAIARGEMTELRKQALGTTATFADLVRNFQLNVGQGFNAGLQLDEFREIALLFSQGATLLGLPQNQLAEEIRSVLQGTIRARDTRIAVALGITNEDIKNAIEAGTAYEFLLEKFDGIKAASESLRDTLPVIASDLTDAFQIASGEGAEPLRAALAKVGADIRDSLVGNEGKLSEGVFEAFASILDPLKGVVELFGEIKKPLAEVTAAFTELSFNVLESFVQGIVASRNVISALAVAFNAMSSTLNLVQAFFRTVGGSLLGRAIANLVAFNLAVRAVAVSLLLLSKAGLLTRGLLGLGVAARKAATGFGVLKTAMLAVSLPAAAATGAIVALVAGLEFASRRFESVARGLDKALDKILFGANVIKDLTGDGGLEGALVNQQRAQKALDQIAFQNKLLVEQRGLLRGKRKENEASIREEIAGIQRVIALNEQFLRDDGLGFLVPDANPFKDGFFDDIAKFITEGISGSLAKETKDEGPITALLNSDLNKLKTSGKLRDQLADLVRDRDISGASATGAAGKAQEALFALVRATREENEKLNTAMMAHAAIVFDATQSFEQRIVAEARLRDLADEKAERQAQSLAILQEQLKVIERLASFEAKQGLDQAKVDFTRQLALSGAPNERSRIAIEARAAVKESRIEEESLAFALAEQTLSLKNQLDLQEELTGTRSSANDELTAAAQDELDTLTLQLDTRKQLTEQAERQVAIAERNEKLSDRQAGAQQGLSQLSRQFGDEQSTSNQITGTFNALTQGAGRAISESFRVAFTGEGAVDFASIGLEIGAGAATAIAQGFIEQFIFDPLVSQMAELFGVEIQSLSVQQLQLAALEVIALNTAAPPIAVPLVPGPAGAGGGGRYFGGPVGFDEGGAVSGKSLNHPVPGLRSADRIPAMVRRGEYVATPEMNKRVPGLFNSLEKIRHGVHNVPNFGTLRSASIPGFATGGGVSTDVAPAGGFSGGGGTQVLPVLVTDSRSLRRIHDTPQFTSGALRRTNAAVIRSAGRVRAQ